MSIKRIKQVMQEMNLQINRQATCTKVYEFDEDEECMKLGDIEPGEDYQQGIVVYRRALERERKEYDWDERVEYDWDERAQIKEFTTFLKEHHSLTQEEVKQFYAFVWLDCPEEIILQVFNAPIEEFLTHPQEKVRQAGLTQLNDKSN